MVETRSKWEDELGRWLKPFLDRLGHKARRRMCPLYISGLIGPGDRKSVQPMAARLAPGDYDQLRHFIADSVWDAGPLETELLAQADRLVGGKDAVLVIDDTAMPEKGDRSVSVAPQYASSLRKTANCQTLVSLTLARGEVPVMVALRLFVSRELDEQSGAFEAGRRSSRVPRIADQARDRPGGDRSRDRRRFGCVLADAGYGLSAPFCQGPTTCGLAWAVGIPRHLKVYPVEVKLIWPVAGRGWPRKRHIPDILSRPAEDILANAKWPNVSWRNGTKGRLEARFAAVRVRTSAADQGHGPAASSGGRSLAHRRTQNVGREEI
jgi:SRSO17 transposase